MLFQILNRWSLKVIVEIEAETRNDAIKLAIKNKANLRGSDLRGSDLSGSDLSGSNLRGSDLSGVPVIENIHQRIYDAASQPNAFDMSTWHQCETTHCRAGWVVILAGDAGKAMEWCIGTPAAAAIIYIASDPKLEKVPNFYDTNENALEDMKRLAEIEKTAV